MERGDREARNGVLTSMGDEREQPDFEEGQTTEMPTYGSARPNYQHLGSKASIR
jgi:hypothetical protein